MNWDDTNLTNAWDMCQRHCAFIFPGPLSKSTKKEKSATYYCGWEKKEEIFTVPGLLTENEHKK